MTRRARTIVSHFCSQRKLGDLLLAPSSATSSAYPTSSPLCHLEPLLFPGCLRPQALPASPRIALDRPFRISASWPLYGPGVAKCPQLRCPQSFPGELPFLSPSPSDHLRGTAVCGGDAGERGSAVKPSSVTVGKAVVLGWLDQVISDTLVLPMGTNRSLMSAQ